MFSIIFLFPKVPIVAKEMIFRSYKTFRFVMIVWCVVQLGIKFTDGLFSAINRDTFYGNNLVMVLVQICLTPTFRSILIHLYL